MENDNRQNIVEIRSVALGYGERVLVEEATLGFARGEFTALVGRNGTGKSTLLRAIAGLLKPLSGEILIDGRDISKMNSREIAARISLVSTEEIRVQNLSVWDVVGIGRAPYTNWVGSLTDGDKEIVCESLELVGMSGYARRTMDSLSDGERQRVMIARALAQDTDIILLDEPTAFLDISNKYEICLLLQELAHSQSKCVICSTHDLSISLELCDAVAMIADNGFYYGTTESLINDGTIQRLFDGTRLVFDTGTRSVKMRW